MNGARLLLSILMLSFPAVALPVVRRTGHPKSWAIIIAISLGAGLALVEASLIHAALPVTFSALGFDELAEACRTLGGHILGATSAFGVFAGSTALVIGVQAIKGGIETLRAQQSLRNQVSRGIQTAIGGHDAVVLPLRRRWAVALPGASPTVLVSTKLVSALEQSELNAVVRHEAAHLRHNHVRFLLLGAAVGSGFSFLPWAHRATIALNLALERWADEIAASESSESRGHVRSAIGKLARITPSALAGDRIRALTAARVDSEFESPDWRAAASTVIPLVVGLAVTLVVHIAQIVELAKVANG